MKGIRLNLIIWEKENHYKAKDVAKKLGITDAMYCNYKKGTATPTLEFAYRFIEAYPNVDVLELMKKFD